MRVLWLSPWLRPIARVCTESLQAAGAKVQLITADLHPESDAARSYETVLLGRPVPTADWVRLARAYKSARHFKPDVVVTEFLRDPRWRIFGSLAPRLAICHDDKPHDETHTAQWWIRSFIPWDARADGTIVYSEYVANSLRQSGSRPPIYIAPLVTDLHPSKVPSFVPASERKNFLLIGRQRPYKNHEVVFSAWHKHIQGPAWRGDELVLIGNGDITPDLPPHTRWIRGSYEYDAVIRELASAKGSFVHSRSASQSGVQLMSMQLGVPPIVSNAGGLPEYQPPGLSITGIDDVDALSKTIDELADPVQVHTQSQLALDHYTRFYDPKISAERLLEIFDDVIKRSKKAIV